MDAAFKGQLNTLTDIDIKIKEQNQESLTTIYKQNSIDSNNLQSLLLCLHEQSSAASPPGHLPYQCVCDFLQYLRHFAQIGILYEPKLAYIFVDLHKAKDQDYITVERFRTSLEQMKTINYVYAYDHLNLVELDNFLNDMIVDGNLTRGQAWTILDRLIDLCRLEPVTSHDMKTLLIDLQLEHNRQQRIYPKLIARFQSLAEAYSPSLAELYSLERELHKILLSSNNNIKRLPDEVRRRLNDMILFCKQFSMNRTLLEQVFGPTMNYKFYNKMKEIFKTKNLISRKQSLTAIVQIHKHFVHISRLTSQAFLSDDQLDLILENIRIKCSKEQNYFEDMIRHMAELGHLQDKSFVEYLTEQFLSNESSSSNVVGGNKLRTWPLTLDLDHPNVREIVKHLTQLELEDKIDSGTSIEIQNRLNRIARFGKWSTPQIQLLINGILTSQGKRYLSDRDGFQALQSYRLILNDIAHAMELEFYIQQLTSAHRLTNDFNYRFRDFLYQILQHELPIDELSRYRLQLNEFHHVKQLDVDQVKRLIEFFPNAYDNVFPFTLTDQLLQRLQWDGKVVNQSIRDQLLKLERSGLLSPDTFEEIYSNLCRTSDMSHLSSKDTDRNQLLLELFEKVNDLHNDGSLDLQQSIEIKEQIYFLEGILNSIDLSQIITIQSRLLNSSNQHEFHRISDELKVFVRQEQFRLSKAQYLISTWHLNKEKSNSIGKQIIKLCHELANLNYLGDSSTILLFNRYLGMKQRNATVHRHLIKDLQRLKDRAIIAKQAVECIRSIEARIYKIDYRRRFHEILIKQLEDRLKQILTNSSHSFDQHVRLDICKKINELVETYVKSDANEYSSDQLLSTFDASVTQMMQGQLRPSKTRNHHVLSDATVPTISSSLGSLQSIV